MLYIPFLGTFFKIRVYVGFLLSPFLWLLLPLSFHLSFQYIISTAPFVVLPSRQPYSLHSSNCFSVHSILPPPNLSFKTFSLFQLNSISISLGRHGRGADLLSGHNLTSDHWWQTQLRCGKELLCAAGVSILVCRKGGRLLRYCVSPFFRWHSLCFEEAVKAPLQPFAQELTWVKKVESGLQCINMVCRLRW